MFDTRTALDDMAHQIRSCRVEEHLTLQKLASRCGVAASTIHKVEKQQMVPTISVFLKIAKGLGRRPDELIRDRHDSGDPLATATEPMPMPNGSDESKADTNVGVWHIDLAARELLPSLDLDPFQRAIVLVERGPLHLLAGERHIVLKSGDSIAIDGGRIQSQDDQMDPVKLTLIVSPPGDLARCLGAPAPSTPVYQSGN